MVSLRRLLWARRIKKLTAWEMAVATAAPAVFIPKPKGSAKPRPMSVPASKMKMGSRTMFRMPPVVMPTMP